jgi:hypothetical protein
MECTVEDFGMNHIKGTWFLLTYATREEEVMVKEMEEILANRIE